MKKNVSYGTGKSWLRQRDTLNSSAMRRPGKNRVGRPVKVSQDKLNEMLSEENPTRDMPWDVQIDHFQLDCTSRTMQRTCNRRRPKADRYRMAIVKPISLKNKQLRVKYDCRHVIETMNSFWQYVYFTNETHFDPNEVFSKRVLREESTRYEAANMQVMSQMKKMKLHFEASIS
jgi:transposase